MKKTNDLAGEEDSIEAKEAILVDDILSKTFLLILKYNFWESVAPLFFFQMDSFNEK